MSSEVISNGNGSKTEVNEELTNLNAQETPNKSHNKPSLVFEDLNYEFLRKIAYFRYGSISNCGRAMHMSRSQASQILNGLFFPKTEETIRLVANCLKLDPMILARFFAQQEIKKEMKNGNM